MTRQDGDSGRRGKANLQKQSKAPKQNLEVALADLDGFSEHERQQQCPTDCAGQLLWDKFKQFWRIKHILHCTFDVLEASFDPAEVQDSF